MLFLSHSSQDKQAVTALAFDLLVADIPVWFDEWEIEAGDSLLEKISGGIGASSYLALLLTPRSVTSEWVEREIDLALQREAREGRKFLLPIVVSPCEIPQKIAERVHIDLSRDYTVNFERLVTLASGWGINGAAVSWERQIVPLRFANGLYLDESPLEARMQTIAARRPENAVITKEQILVLQDEHYTALRRNLQQHLDAAKREPTTPYERLKSLQDIYRRVQYWENALLSGAQIILNELSRPLNGFAVARVVHYFARLVRAETLTYLRLFRDLGGSVPAGYAEDASYPFSSDTFERLFGVDDIASVDVWPEGSQSSSETVTVWCERKRPPARELAEWGQDAAESHWAGDFLHKFFLPQMVYKHIVNGSPLYWRPESLVMGIS